MGCRDRRPRSRSTARQSESGPDPPGAPGGMEFEMAPTATCRLFVYLARQAPVAVVLRRGPSAWARLSLWQTGTDTFAHGQWTKARIYERRSDLSADGSLFVCFARKSGGRAEADHDTWVAVSRPPWFAALALWFVGGTYCAGGFFPDPRSLWLGFAADPPDQGRLPAWLSTTDPATGYTDRTPNWPERTVWLNRLRRDGWTVAAGVAPETWRRPDPTGTRTLAMTLRSDSAFATHGGPHVVEYAVESAPGGERVSLGRADWADWDQRGRLVVARGGQLLHLEPSGSWQEIANFNDQVPDPAPAPETARIWPEPTAPAATGG